MIKLEELLRGELPIWDRGTLMRGLTLEESRDLASAFRGAREDYAVTLKHYHELREQAEEMQDRLYKTIENLLYAKGRKNVAKAKRDAMDLLHKYGFYDQ